MATAKQPIALPECAAGPGTVTRRIFENEHGGRLHDRHIRIARETQQPCHLDSSRSERAHYRHYFRRDDLYPLVWRSPVSEIAGGLGVFDVALANSVAALQFVIQVELLAANRGGPTDRAERPSSGARGVADRSGRTSSLRQPTATVRSGVASMPLRILWCAR